MSEKELHILKWIGEVSKKRPELNNFAICPFANNSKYKIVECKASDICPIEEYHVIIFIIEDQFSLEEVQNWVDYYNSKHNNWKFFEDCKSYDTYINNIQTNNGKYNLILCQPKNELRVFREKISKTEYYDLWENEYLQEILEDDYDLLKNRDRNLYKSSDNR